MTSAKNNSAMSVSPQRFETLTVASGKLAVFFSTQSCAECTEMSPAWQRVEAMYGGSTAFLEVSYSMETSQIFAKYDVTNTPTFIIFVDGSNVSRHDGVFSSPDKMEQFIQNGSVNSQSSAVSGQLALLESESPALLISVVLGIGVFASPCVLPMLPGYLGLLVRDESGKDKNRVGISSISSFAAGLSGILLVGILFVVLGSIFWSVIDEGKLLIAFVLMAFGAASILGLGVLSSLPRLLRIQQKAESSLRGVTSYSFMYGFLSLGCSLPLMAGAMLNILAGVDTTSLIARLLAFGIGFAIPLAFFTYAAGRGVGFSASKLGKGSAILQKIGGGTMIAGAILLIFTSI